jgi:hypothetical protein
MMMAVEPNLEYNEKFRYIRLENIRSPRFFKSILIVGPSLICVNSHACFERAARESALAPTAILAMSDTISYKIPF